MNVKNEIIENLNNPGMLEKIYREHPEIFTECFHEIYKEHEDSIILKVWRERLFYGSDQFEHSVKEIKKFHELFVVVVISLFSGTIAKLPNFINGIDEHFFYSRNLSFFVLPAIAFYFAYKAPPKRNILFVLCGAFLFSLIFINLLPNPENSDTIILSSLHMPFFLWTIVGIAYIGNLRQLPMKRMDYLKYNGEVLIYTSIILIGGVILTGVTNFLFYLIKINIFMWYKKYIVIYGAVASPIVATYLAENRKESKIAPIIAKIFSPLFLITLIAYLIAVVIQQKSPYSDRNFLILFNVILLIVLAITIFSISERYSHNSAVSHDYINVSLVFVALIVDVVALSAIIFRLASYGFTPNRIAVLGANVLVFIHLVGIVYHYINFFREKSQISKIEYWITRYLPAYTAWTAFITFIFPFLYEFS